MRNIKSEYVKSFIHPPDEFTVCKKFWSKESYENKTFHYHFNTDTQFGSGHLEQ